MTNLELKQKLDSMLSDSTRYAVGRFEDRIEDDDLLNEPKTSKTVETLLSKYESIDLALQYASYDVVERVTKDLPEARARRRGGHSRPGRGRRGRGRIGTVSAGAPGRH